MDELERKFSKDMAGIYETAKRELGYHAKYLLRMLADHGALETARWLVGSAAPYKGFTTSGSTRGST